MPFYKKAAKGKSSGYHPYTREDMKRVQWCIDQSIKIAVIPSGNDWRVELNINKKIHLDPKVYTAEEANKKMYEYYKYYYDKYKD